LVYNLQTSVGYFYIHFLRCVLVKIEHDPEHVLWRYERTIVVVVSKVWPAGQGFNFWQGHEFPLCYKVPSDFDVNSNPWLITTADFFFLVRSARKVKLITHFHLVPRKIVENITSPTLHSPQSLQWDNLLLTLLTAVTCY